MDFGFFTDDWLFDFFRQNKTKISTIGEPLMFLRHLKDNGLITDELSNSGDDDGVYHALEYIEKRGNGKKNVRRFWKCVTQEHILQHYSVLSDITEALKHSLESQTKKKRRERSENQGTQVKKRRTESSSASDQAGPSSQSTSSQKTTDKNLKRDLPSPPDSSTQDSSSCLSLPGKTEDLWNMSKHVKWLPVTCGNEEALLDRDALYNRKRDCIKCHGTMITPVIFEKMGGKRSCKSWKTSILCQGTTLQSLIEGKVLKTPESNGKFTLRK